jgi:type IV pilus assembly protein PilW
MPSNSVRMTRGVTLIELLVSIALGLSVVLVILTFYQSFSGGSKSSRSSQAMNENAESAFQLLAQQFRQADFNPRQTRSATPVVNPLRIVPTAAPGMGVFACANGFSNGSGATPADNIQSLTCNGTGTSTITYAFAVQFEADAFSPGVAGGTPTDCRGFAVAAQSVNLATTPVTSVNYFVVENRYVVANGGLTCTGNGGTSTFGTPDQPLVENIESMNLSFGLSQAGVTGTVFPAGYLDANAIGPASGAGTGVDPALAALTPIDRWNLVKIVRVCLVVKADKRTLFEPEGGTGSVFGSYFGCDPATRIDITDGFERRAYIRHFALRNRI